jgi:ABC-2 type transport system ATP-binding protein
MSPSVRAADAALEADDLVKTYPNGPRALDGLSLRVAPGTVFALLGPNGAGKSTTVKILTTLTRPDSGRARVCGLDVVTQAPAVRRLIGTVGQRIAVDPDATGRENLLLQGAMYGIRGRALTTRADELLDRFGLRDAAARLARTWSGGMQRRLDLAMGLIHRPRVLFLDEPTTGLDPEVRAVIWAELQALAAMDGLTLLLTTHYLDEADRLADRIAIVDAGRIVATGTPDELKSELRGDALVVDLAEPVAEPVLRGSLRGEVRELTVTGRTVRARVDAGATAVPRVLARLEAAGVAVTAVTIARPSLDDVYLRHTGRSLTAGHDAEMVGAGR